MKQLTTKGIILTRVDYQEADRILTVLTPDQGKLRLIAKGVRRQKSKLAGGLELFSVSDITYIQGRSEIFTTISTRLDTYYGHIVSDIDRTMLAYEILKRVNSVTEDLADSDYFDILHGVLSGLDDLELASAMTQLWFGVQLLKTSGHVPNLKTDIKGKVLEAGQRFIFDYDSMTFTRNSEGMFTDGHIKLLRIASGMSHPSKLKQINGAEDLLNPVSLLISQLTALHLKK